jgi:hypothetical protein
MDRLNRRHPERSFTGGEESVPPEPEPAAPRGDDDVVEKLERLRILRDDDVITDEEFAAAKTRLLGRD